MSSDPRIAISGKSGCGNTTVSCLVAERLGLRVINYTFKTMARDMGIGFDELCLMAEEDNRYDRELDERQILLAAEPGCVLGSRLAIWLLGDADLKVYLDGSSEIRAARIAAREDVEQAVALAEMTARDDRDRNRYVRLYGLDVVVPHNPQG